MQPFTYHAGDSTAALVELHREPGAEYLAGGTTLVDLMKLHVMTPSRVVDLSQAPLRSISEHDDRIEVGALASNSDMAHHPAIARDLPLVSQALLAGASVQIRNLASAAGNVLQRTRCSYFRDPTARCNKRTPGTGCDALQGFNRMHAILGGSTECIASHPSDLCVALAAIEATIATEGPSGPRILPFAGFHTLPGDKPQVETVLAPGELIVGLRLPRRPWFRRSAYVKVRDRSSYAFALASAAVAVDLDGDMVRDVRIAFGGIGTVPWRAAVAEDRLRGRKLELGEMRAAARAALAEARTTPLNAFKVPLAEQVLVRALRQAGGAA